MVTRDHYLVLGVSRTAASEEIRRAYRLRALERHPDRAGPDRTGDFQQLSDAYHVLADPDRRAAYDAELRRKELRPRGTVVDLRRRSPRATEAEPLVPPRPPRFRDFDEGHDVLERVLGELLRSFAASDMPRSEHIDVSLDLTTEQASSGALIVVRLSAVAVCRACEGTGTDGWHPCRVCGQDGVLRYAVPVQVRIPAKVRDGTVLETRLGPYGAPTAVLRTWIRIIE